MAHHGPNPLLDIKALRKALKKRLAKAALG